MFSKYFLCFFHSFWYLLAFKENIFEFHRNGNEINSKQVVDVSIIKVNSLNLENIKILNKYFIMVSL